MLVRLSKCLNHNKGKIIIIIIIGLRAGYLSAEGASDRCWLKARLINGLTYLLILLLSSAELSMPRRLCFCLGLSVCL